MMSLFIPFLFTSTQPLTSRFEKSMFTSCNICFVQVSSSLMSLFFDETRDWRKIPNLNPIVFMMSLFTTTGSMPTAGGVFIPWGYHQPSSQHFCVDMNYHWYGHTYKLNVYKTSNFWNTKAFLPKDKITVAIFCKTFRNFWSSMLFNFVLYLFFSTFRWNASGTKYILVSLANLPHFLLLMLFIIVISWALVLNMTVLPQPFSYFSFPPLRSCGIGFSISVFRRYLFNCSICLYPFIFSSSRNIYINGRYTVLRFLLIFEIFSVNADLIPVPQHILIYFFVPDLSSVNSFNWTMEINSSLSLPTSTPLKALYIMLHP